MFNLAFAFQSLAEQIGPQLADLARQPLPSPRRGFSGRGEVPAGQRGASLTPAERRAIMLGLWRPTRKARHRPGRLFKGHRP